MAFVSTVRADTRAAMLTYLQALVTANPTVIRQAFRTLPRSLRDRTIYIGRITESNIGLDAQVLTRQPQVDLVIVEGVYDNPETMDRLDITIDAVVSYMADNAHSRVGNAVIVSLGDDELPDFNLPGPNGTSIHYAAGLVRVGLDIQEGLR